MIKELSMNFIVMIFLSFFAAGCASTPVYNPMTNTYPSEIALNQRGFQSLKEGMSLEDVHQAMGQELAIGYGYQSPNYKPITIPNPYKSETVKNTPYVIEYYIEAIRQPDGVVSDNELMPLVFKDGKLIGRGWPLVHSLNKPAA